MGTQPRIIRTHESVDNRLSKPLKIVVTGPFAAGKTTLIKTISEVAVVGTDRDVTDESGSVKASTTVAMDFGRITFSDGCSLFLFGTPGQRRFEIMWEVLAEGMIGLIVLVSAADGRSAHEARDILESFRDYADVPYVVGVTHIDIAGASQEQVADDVRKTLRLPDEVALISCDVRRREDVKRLLLETLYGVMRRLDAKPAESTPETGA
jgi:uncharacterized protein